MQFHIHSLNGWSSETNRFSYFKETAFPEMKCSTMDRTAVEWELPLGGRRKRIRILSNVLLLY